MGKSAILSADTAAKGKSNILAVAAAHGSALMPGGDGPVSPSEAPPPPKRVTIEKILNGFKVDMGYQKEAHAKDWDEAVSIAKAFMDGKAPDESEDEDNAAEETDEA
jgi:hypothetical protein